MWLIDMCVFSVCASPCIPLCMCGWLSVSCVHNVVVVDAMRSGVYWADEAAMVSDELKAKTWDDARGEYVRLQATPKHIDMIFYVCVL